jgi:DNA helicase-2/ATP-dependent DNA helicase PcrA
MKFDEYYKKLNKEQKEAVDTIEGPVMVIAGPGTGKTQILTLRIANILQKTDTPPEAILALTFTESGVASMRRRLAEIIGSPAYHVRISTFHSFCNDVIRNYPEEFPHIIGAQSITDVDQIRIMEQAIDTSPLKVLRPFGDRFYYLGYALSAINKLKQEGVGPEQFSDIVAKEAQSIAQIDDLYYESGAHKGKMKGKYADLIKQTEKNKELAILYGAYQASLRSQKLYDYSDMIIEVLQALQTNAELLLMLQERCQYILVDEHQDTNNAQNKILELLANFYENPNLFVVGDEKQAIFRFQGASLENFLYFKHLYKQAKLINLQHNYRSTQTILDFATSLMKRGELKSNTAHDERKLSLFAFESAEGESYFLAKHIKSRIEAGAKPEEIAVLYHENRDAMPIAHMMEKLGVPFVIESSQNILEDDDIRKLLLIMRAVRDFGDAGALIEALHVDFLGVEPLDVYKLSQQAHAERANPYDLIAQYPKLQPIAHNLSLWKTLSRNKGAAEAFESIVRESGLLASVLAKPNAPEKLEKIHALFDQLKALVENHKDYALDDFLGYLDMLQEHDILIKNKQSSPESGFVRLMTAHSSKGQEFDYVYIANLFDGHWGNRRRIEHFKMPRAVYSLLDKAEASEDADNTDERNLLYVALTRGRKEVVLSYAAQGLNKKEQLPSQFLEEIDARHMEQGDTGAYEKELKKNREILFAPAISTGTGIQSKEFVQELFKKYGMSVTALNNYLTCPWQYFYRNLVRIPEIPNKHLMYGSAIHGALKAFFDKFSQPGSEFSGSSSGGTAAPENLLPGKRFLIQRFKELLARQPIEMRDYQEALEKGEASLGGYFDEYHATWRKNVLSEFRIDGIELAPDIRLNGSIDKMEILDSSNSVNVVDYKTGRPKSRAMIAGDTASSEGDYKRQLVFYNLLLNRYLDGKFTMVSGEVDFVEPDKGKYKKEKFQITPAEIKDLEKEILRVADEILNLKFWDSKCDDKECRYCGLRGMMRA